MSYFPGTGGELCL